MILISRRVASVCAACRLILLINLAHGIEKLESDLTETVDDISMSCFYVWYTTAESKLGEQVFVIGHSAVKPLNTQ